MLIPDRRRAVLAHVRRHGAAQVSGLATDLGVSEWTVRRDLDELERQGSLRRTHGGAVVTDHAASAISAHDDAKAAIAAAAAERLPREGTIMVLGGSTTEALLPHLRDTRLTVVTNGLDIAYGLRSAHEVTVVMLGGYLHREQMTLLGPMTAAAMADLHVEFIVAGAYGVDPDAGVTGAKIVQAGYHRSMLGHTEKLMVLADSSKLGRRGPTLLAELNDVDLVITDADAHTDVVGRLRGAGPEVVLAS